MKLKPDELAGDIIRITDDPGHDAHLWVQFLQTPALE